MKRQRPRRADEIFDVAVRLLVERGYDAVTVEDIARDAGVDKTTLYRWWSGKDELLSDALRRGDLLALTVPDTGTLRSDLVAMLGQIATLLESPATRTLLASLIGGGRPALAVLANEFVDDRLGAHTEILTRAVDRGEVDSGTTAEELFHPLIGAVWIRVLLRGRSADEDFVSDLVDRALRGVAPG
ncbi:TetR/AcrR family transcriptional regulator [Rhodococcus rhodnii]|uniref:TetR family transcriptional regulator n=2 Tax=Rhodococcus rhodnii TaxID=38312 RepID=R7WNT8_9NOCA|nr:TetR/AcrR family transcriptional regulator [Rhodococcus rhodnii]EOM76978.1 TetR family transcriptional regulator [Rhodococcus rhodnii LMG 5362]TXG89940.1 TetR/AcrR family transcriptional regulator [Rhodococcus rhodnii]